MSLRRPDAATLADPDKLLVTLGAFYDAIASLQASRPAASAPALKAITLPLFADLRNTVGDVLGEKGPRGCIVAGGKSVFDGNQGVFAWDQTNRNPDDEANTIKPTAILSSANGRWRRIV